MNHKIWILIDTLESPQLMWIGCQYTNKAWSFDSLLPYMLHIFGINLFYNQLVNNGSVFGPYEEFA